MLTPFALRTSNAYLISSITSGRNGTANWIGPVWHIRANPISLEVPGQTRSHAYLSYFSDHQVQPKNRTV